MNKLAIQTMGVLAIRSDIVSIRSNMVVSWSDIETGAEKSDIREGKWTTWGRKWTIGGQIVDNQ